MLPNDRLGSEPVRLRTSVCFTGLLPKADFPILKLLPPPALGERCHRGLARRLVAVRWPSAFLKTGLQFAGRVSHRATVGSFAYDPDGRAMLPRKIDTLILDLDNTIFDWFAMWYASFKPIYDEILAASARPQDEVEADIRRVHQTRRTSEYTFLIEELDVLREIRAREDIRTRFHNALETSRHGRDQSLQLYPTVFSSLWRIKNAGTKIIGYTESMRFYSSYRLKRFGLDGVIETLFSPKDHDMPAGVSLNQLRRFPDNFYELQVTKAMHTPTGELKPNPKVLRDIIEVVGSSPDRCAYVGDSIFKDVAMARETGVFDVHAQYGEPQKRPEYEILQRVSHWTEDDVQRE